MFPLLIYLSLGTAAPPAKPDSAAKARKIITHAIDSHGGEMQLERLSKAWRSKIRGKARSLEITGEMLQDTLNKSRITTTLHSWIPIEVTIVGNNGHTWRRIAGFTSEVTGKELTEMQDGQYRHQFRNLLPLLREPGFTLSALSETNVAGQPAAGIRVQSKGHRDIDLYFDKSTGLVVKTESRVLPDGKPPIVLEQILSQYRDFDGLKMATKFTKYENHKLTSVEEFVDFKFVDYIEDREFEKP